MHTTTCSLQYSLNRDQWIEQIRNQSTTYYLQIQHSCALQIASSSIFDCACKHKLTLWLCVLGLVERNTAPRTRTQMKIQLQQLEATTVQNGRLQDENDDLKTKVREQVQNWCTFARFPLCRHLSTNSLSDTHPCLHLCRIVIPHQYTVYLNKIPSTPTHPFP